MSARAWFQAFAILLAAASHFGLLASAFAQSDSFAPAPPGGDPASTPQTSPNDAPIDLGPPLVMPDCDWCDPLCIPSIDNVFRACEPVDYVWCDSTVGTIVAMPDLEFPGTINTVTRGMMRDQQALSVSDILRDIGGAVQSNSGLAPGTGDLLHPDQFLLRGLEVTPLNFRKNGFLDPTSTPRDFANVERVDVLKGPASVLYGAAQPAGTVNLVTKTALADRFAWGGMTFGSYGLQRYQFDANSMNEAGDLLVRVNGVYQTGESFRNFGYNERTFIAPVVTKLLGSDTAITWEGEFHHDRRMVDSGLIAVNGNPRAFAPDTFFGAATDFAEFHDYRSTFSFIHRFSDEWQLYLGQTSLFYDAPSRRTIPQTGFTTTLTPGSGFYAGAPGIGGLLNRRQETAEATAQQNHAVIANLSGEVDGLGGRHNLLVGTELDWLVVNDNVFTTSIPGLDPALTIDPNTPAQPFPGSTPIGASFEVSNQGYYQNRFGVYLQDVVEVTDQLSFMAGARWDSIRLQYDREFLFGGFPTFTPPPADENFDYLTPRAGVVYEVVPESVSLYGLYTQSFSPPSRSIFAQAPLAPEYGEMFEIGMKTRLAENLSFTVGAFYIERENVAVQLTNFSVVNTARQQSRGVEFNLVGQWTERFSTVSNYTYVDAEQSGPTGFASLNGRIRGVPFGSGNIWTRYNLIQDDTKTVGLGLGYVYVGDRRGDYSTPLRLPSYSRWDVGLFSQYGRWDLTAYVENIFDIRYETGSISQYQIYPGAPLNFRLQVGVNF